MLIKYMIDTNIIDKVMESGLANHIEKRNDILISQTSHTQPTSEAKRSNALMQEKY